MCTVTFLPLKNNNFILTSSRDVPFLRKKALLPKKYIEDNIELYYPKDGQAEGTWIGISEKQRLICLLNGGFNNHQQQDSYARSRGLIVKELLKTDDITKACKDVDLENVEPFTLVIVEWDLHLFLFEFVWDGKQKYLKILPLEPTIWSSSTLYDESMKKKRKDWFADWLNKLKIQSENFKIIKDKILDFHHNAGIGNPKIDVMMKRPKVGTASITQVGKNDKIITMDYKKIDQIK